MINLFQPSLGDVEVEGMRKVFLSNWLGPGMHVQTFERMFGEYIDRPAPALVVVTSCTEALFQAVNAWAASAEARSIFLIEDAAIGLGSLAEDKACGTLGK